MRELERTEKRFAQVIPRCPNCGAPAAWRAMSCRLHGGFYLHVECGRCGYGDRAYVGMSDDDRAYGYAAGRIYRTLK